MSFLDSIFSIGAPILGGALGAEAGGLLGDAAGIGANVGADIGGALGGGIGGYFGNHESLGAGALGAIGGAALGPGIDNSIAGLLPGNNFGVGSLGGGIFDLFNGFGGASSTGGGAFSTADGGLGVPTGPHDVIGGLSPAGVSSLDATGAGSALGAGGLGTGGGISDFLDKNKSWLIPAALGGASALVGQQPIPNQAQLTSLAQGAQGVAGLENSLATGKLPPGAEQMVQTSLQDSITGIQSHYASMGLSGSTMEQQDIAAAQQRSQAMRFQLAQQTTQTGLSAAGLSDQIYGQLAQLQLSQDQGLQNALAEFAAASAGGGVPRQPGQSLFG